MSECEDIVKEYLDTIDGLAEMIAKSQQEQEIWGLKIKLFQPIKLVVGSQYIVGIVVKVTKQVIAVLDALGHINMIRISKLNMIATVGCDDFIRHRNMYRIRLRWKGRK